MKKILLPALVLAFIACAFSESKIEKKIALLKNGNWATVSEAREDLIKLEDDAMNALVTLTADSSIVPLTGAEAIVYPGTTKYNGKGTAIDFDLDRVAVRAGWIIEEISFNDFGYRAGTVSDAILLDIRKQHPEEMRKFTAVDVSLAMKGTTQERTKKYTDIAAKVSQWWSQNKTGWSRYTALKDALKSDSPRRQLLALQYLRTGERKINGLSKDSWEKELKSLVLNVSKNGKPGPNEEAKLLLNDTDLYWLSGKK